MEKLAPGSPTSNRRCISISSQRKALQVLISKMESYTRCLFYHCMPRKLRGTPVQWSCTIHTSRLKDSLRSHSSVGQKALETPNALFSSEQGNMIRISGFGNADPSNLRGSLLEGNKGSLAQSGLVKQEFHVESLNECIGEVQRKLKSKDWHYRTHNTDLLNLEENKFDYKKNHL